jgi:hypothetical protein
MVKMYSTRRPAAERTCVAQRVTFMLTILVLTVLLSMRRFLSSSSLNMDQAESTISKDAGADSSTYSNLVTGSDNNTVDEEAAQGDTFSTSTSTLSSIIQGKFPSFDNGGVVIFYHASRTGGLTIRQNFNQQQENGIKYVKLGHSTQAMNMADKIVRHVLNRNSLVTRTSTTMMNNNNAAAAADAADAADYADVDGGVAVAQAAPRRETFVMEIPSELTTLMQLSKLLEQWRILAAEHGTSFFAFTLIRDPVPFHLSFFNTYIAPPMEPTMENLLQSLPRNEQCRRLGQNSDNSDNIVVVEEEGQESSSSTTTSPCEEAYNWMRSGLDWIGTTEKLNHDTLPILSHLLLQDASLGQSMPRVGPPPTAGGEVDNNPDNSNSNNNIDNKLLVQHLSLDDVTRIRELSEMDQRLYQNVLHDFSIDIMEDSNNE